jgi:hypothetical protein
LNPRPQHILSYASQLLMESLFKSHPVLFLCMPCSILYRQAKVLRKKLAKPVRNIKSVWQVLVLSVWQKGHGLASKTKLNGVCVARRNFEKPADITTSLILFSPACAPSAGPSSFKDAGTQIIVDPE